MSAERTLAFIHNPQTSRASAELLTKSGYLNDIHFSEIVSNIESVLGSGEALNPARQIAPVTFSLAAFHSFEQGLKEYLHPGGLRESPEYKKWITGHSIGENGALVHAGIMDVKDMAWALKVRELVTNHNWKEIAQIIGSESMVMTKLDELRSKVLSGIKGMVLITGLNLEEVEGKLEENGSGDLEKDMSLTLANRNAPQHAVLSYFSKTLDQAHIQERILNLFGDKALVFWLAVSTAYHSQILIPEELIFGFVLSQHNMRARLRSLPEDSNIRLFSPMANRYLKTAEDGYDLQTHQLTWQVGYTNAMDEVKARDDIGLVITADPELAIPKLLRRNNLKIRNINLLSKEGSEQGIQVVGDYLRAA